MISRTGFLARHAIIVVVAMALLGLVSWRYVAVKLENAERVQLRALERAASLATLLGDTVAATLGEVQISHSVARLATEAVLSGHSYNADELIHLIIPDGHVVGGESVTQVSATGPDGFLLWTSVPNAPPRVDLRDREFYQAFVANKSLDKYLGRPIRGKLTDEMMVPFAQAMRGPNGELRAITLVSLRLTMLRHLFDDQRLDPDDVAALVNDADGTIMMRSDMKMAGEKAYTPEPAQMVPCPAQNCWIGPSAIDGHIRYVASQPMRSAGLSVRVGLSAAAQAAALGGLNDALWHWTLLLDAAIVVIAGGGALGLAWLRRSTGNAERADALAKSQTWFRAVTDHMTDGAIVLDGISNGDFRITFASRRAGEILGIPSEQLTGKYLHDFFTLEDQARAVADRQLIASGTRLFGNTHTILRPDGTAARVVISSTSAAKPEYPSELRGVSLLRDVTDDERRDAALAEARAEIDSILEVVPGVIYRMRLNPDGTAETLFVSGSASTQFDFDAEEAKQPRLMSRLAGRDLASEHEAELARVAPAKAATIEYPIHYRDRTIWVRDTASIQPRSDGSRDYVGFTSDITAERNAGSEVERLNWALAAYARSASALIHFEELGDMMERVCASICADDTYPLAWVGMADDAPGKPVRPAASAGRASEYLAGLTVSWSDETADGRGPAGQAIRSGKSVIAQDMLSEPSLAPWQDRVRAFGLRSTLVEPIGAAGLVKGMLVIYSDRPGAFGEQEIALFEQLAAELDFAIGLKSERARFIAAEAARHEAEEILHNAVRLGPGVLYQARVYPGSVDVVAVHGDARRITNAFDNGEPCDPALLSKRLSQPAIASAMRLATVDTPVTVEYSITNNGQTRWLRNAVRGTGGGAGHTDVVGYIMDVTREKSEQLHMQQVNTLLTLGEMATGMAHELNQPLASISFAAQNGEFLLDMTPPNLPALHGKLEKIRKEAHRASKLVEHMRIFARNERADPAPTAWRDVLEGAKEILAVRLRGCTLRDELPPDLPPVLGVEIPMEQVMINLISNAIDAYEQSHAGLRDVSVSGHAEDGWVVLQVADRAGGIPDAVLGRLFEPFFTTKQVGKGTGLGLSLCFGTITDMGGTISARNADGGAVFEIRLPAAATAAEAMA